MRKILVPVDLSERSLGAARYAGSLAAEFGAELVFLHALRHGWPLEPAEKEVRDRIEVEAGAHRFVFREGLPVPVILETAETERADHILIPARGRPPLARLLDGSIAARVLRGAPCPVWVGVNNFLPLASRPIRTILCGLSLGPRASAVLRWAAGLAGRLQASLSVIHAIHSLKPNPGIPGDHEWKFWLKKMARDDIRSLQVGAGTDAEVWLESGTPLAAIPSLADQLRADLLVVGKSPHKRILGDLRTLPYELACRAPCPVASV